MHCHNDDGGSNLQMQDMSGYEGTNEPLRLTPQQQDVMQALLRRETDRYPLSRWYLGAIRTLGNHYNPDRFGQAAHSLRELVEKLPKVVGEGDLAVDTYDHGQHRRNLYGRFAEDLQRYAEGWTGKIIDRHLANTLDEASIYFEKAYQPTQREQIGLAIIQSDPLASQLGADISNTKRDTIYELSQNLQRVAHHAKDPDVDTFQIYVQSLERVILDLLAPITAQNQQELQSILRQSDKTEQDIELALTLMKRTGANYTFFFDKVDDPYWIPVLREKGYFDNPPEMEPGSMDRSTAPYWWPLHYLARMAIREPSAVLEIVRKFPTIHNTRVRMKILEIARQLPGALSVQLEVQVTSVRLRELQFLAHWYIDVLAHWVAEQQLSAALHLAELLIQFELEVQLEDGDAAVSAASVLRGLPRRPKPSIGDDDYPRLFDEAVKPLAGKAPYETACTLAKAVEVMIRLRMADQSNASDDYRDHSELWCRRLGQIEDFEPSSSILVAGLVFACEGTFEAEAENIANLDSALRGYKWEIFERLRQHLYGKYPDSRTKPWIREFILNKADYADRVHGREFQQMVKRACEHFGEELLTEEERKGVFDAILSAPQREYEALPVEQRPSEKMVTQRRQWFQRAQIAPFASVLFGHYRTHCEELGEPDANEFSDDDYLGMDDARSGPIVARSPRSNHDLVKLSDRELLDYINEWEQSGSWEEVADGSRDGAFVEITVEALAGAFKDVVATSILTNDERCRFWREHLAEIQRTAFVRALVDGMVQYTQKVDIDRIEQCLESCKWILSHADQNPAEGFRDGDRSRENPHWHSSRRAVGDFVEACIAQYNSLGTESQQGLVELLETLCTEFDWPLDTPGHVVSSHQNLFDFAINNTRCRGLQSLVKLATQAYAAGNHVVVGKLMTVLENRLSADSTNTLRLPEYAMLGANAGRLLRIDAVWLARWEAHLFPQAHWEVWKAAFGHFLEFEARDRRYLEVLRQQFEFAVQCLPHPEEGQGRRGTFTNTLSQHLFIYYLWGLYPLSGPASLLEQFYEKTRGHTEQWEALFREVGFMLKNTEQLDGAVTDRVIQFFDWRVKQANADELANFWFWLMAECLDGHWRLRAFSVTLTITRPTGFELHGCAEALAELLAESESGVLECFAKLTDRVGGEHFRISTGAARTILKVGLESTDGDVRQNAERAWDNLLRHGRSELLELN